jgi:glycosyltransferase involved in cell wall biosynthesis
MRVVLTGTGMVQLPPRSGGAVETYVADLFRVLRVRGIPTTLVSDVRPGERPDPTVVRVGSPVDRFPLSPVASSLAHLVGGYLTGRAAWRYLRRQPADDPAILHMHEEVSAALLSHVGRRMPRVFTLHNPPPELGGARLPATERGVRSIGTALTRRFVTRHADLVLGTTSAVRELLVSRWGLPEERVGLLPLPIDTTRYVPGPPSDGRTELLYVGRLDARKNVSALLKMMVGLDPAIRLTIVGDGPMREVVARATQRDGWRHRVRLKVSVAFEELLALYRSSSVFVFPSSLETCGRVIVEAAACGLPVVLPESPIYQDFIDQGFAVPYSDGSRDGLREAVEVLHAEQRWRRSLGRRARASAVARHSYPVFGAGLLHEYSRVAG